MSGRGSRKSRSGQPSASSLQRGESRDWCSVCWSEPQAVCRAESHPLQDFDGAERSVLAEVEALERVLARGRARLYALAVGEARARAHPLNRPVLRVFSPGGGEHGFVFKGGDAFITLAVVEALSAEDKKLICRSLENLKMTFREEFETGLVTSEWCFNVDEVNYDSDDSDAAPATPMAPPTVRAVDKLRDCVDGQEVLAGTVLLVDGSLEVHFQDTRFRRERDSQHAKVFGHVTIGLDALEGRGCRGECLDTEDEACLYCSGRIIWHNCYFLKGVKFVA